MNQCVGKMLAKPHYGKLQREQLSSLDCVRYRYEVIRHPLVRDVLKVQDTIMLAIRDFLHAKGFAEILAPIIGPVSDPGIRGAKQASIDYYGVEYKLMSSMILYKQMAICAIERIYSLSPNIRLEPVETVSTGRHLSEFRQIDLEAAHATYRDAMKLAEGLLCYVIKIVILKRRQELGALGRTLQVPSLPFKRIKYKDALEKVNSIGYRMEFGEEIPWDAEAEISRQYPEPFFITDYPVGARGFYYLEHKGRPGFLRDFDLIYPEGYGEAASGGEREHRYERIVSRMRLTGEDPLNYGWYIKMLKKGIPPSTGFGIGVERLTRYICGLEKVWEATPFPKVPGVISP